MSLNLPMKLWKTEFRDAERASAALERAIELDSISVAARFDLGRARQQLGELEAAAAHYQEVVAQRSRNRPQPSPPRK